MFAQVMSLGIYGMDGFKVTVDVNCSGGMPRFSLVGLPDAAVKESQERVRAAIRNSGYKYPIGGVVVNLAPANIKKIGAMYDLPIAIGILIASGTIDPKAARNMSFVGELALDGSLRQIPGALPGALFVRGEPNTSLILPLDNAREVECVDGITILPAASLKDVVEHLQEGKHIEPITPVPYDKLVTNNKYEHDLMHVRGQQRAKRALEIAAAGGHNMLMIGPPGSGKTMLAGCAASILPDMSFEEALEVTRVYSAAGRLGPSDGMMTMRPFRSPHHTASAASLVGGGKDAMPGEISYAHNGILFLDELPEYDTRVLEALRQPLEDGNVSVARVHAAHSYPARFMLIAAMNPCKCGYYGESRCTCSPQSVKNYQNRVSGPLLDRIDLRVTVRAVPAAALASRSDNAEPSASVRERVNNARSVQHARYSGSDTHSNAELSGGQLYEHCSLAEEPARMMTLATEKYGLSARSHFRVLRVARTIADLAGDASISIAHITEALAYRLGDGE